MSKKNHIMVLAAALTTINGCSLFSPSWDSGRGRPLRHRILHAAVLGDSLSVNGTMNSITAFTDYGIKVYRAVDDQQTNLTLKSFQIFWMKSMCFEIEFSAPHPDATSVQLDLAFTSRSGLQRITKTVTIERDWGEHPGYLTQLRRWEREPRLDTEQKTKGK